ncbi:General transcription factor 3C polypeptide 5 [Eumeta japonica]|uniref:Regulatory protein zeste n=1 Tax=Eumeta variegata TaxID=151549 RepID=A0A4C1SV26_EUMVA|nr:General transcription factor 3C polypeptide 5 [Eumeta japonica]
MERRKASPEQLNMLLHFLEGDKELAIGKFNGLEGKIRQTNAWIKITEKLNANSGFGSGAIKTPDKWQQTWRDWKSNVKKKAFKIRKNRFTPGNNSNIQLTEAEEKILRLICTNTSVFGLSGVPETSAVSTNIMKWPSDTHFQSSTVEMSIEDEVGMETEPGLGTNEVTSAPNSEGKPLWKRGRPARLMHDKLLSLEEERIRIEKQKLLEKKRCNNIRIKMEKDRLEIEKQRNVLLEKRPGPSFIVPPNFTRCEKPMNYYYTDIHHIKREDRSMPCPRFVFNLVDDFPTEPDPYYINKKQLRFEMYPQAEEEFKKLEKLFEEKPVWSMSEVRYHTKGKIMSLKMLLPCLAVYLSEGPWRAMWVKFGYDPRKDSSARMYQTLDFRVRSTGGMNIMVMNKHKQRRNGKYTKTLRRNVEELSDDDVITEASIYFRPGSIPPQRQIFYQFGNVELPEVQALLAKPTTECHERRGWLEPGVAEQCRDHMFRYVKQALIANNSDDFKLKQLQSDGESGEDDGESSTVEET